MLSGMNEDEQILSVNMEHKISLLLPHGMSVLQHKENMPTEETCS